MIVAKFGGSSVANAEQIKKVAEIIKSNPERKIIVVTAPGKRFPEDTKMTDLLIQLANAFMERKSYEKHYHAVMQRFKEIVNELELSENLLASLDSSLKEILENDTDFYVKLDEIKSFGEDSCAKIIGAYLQALGLHAGYMNPQEAGIIVSDEPGRAQILPESFQKIRTLREQQGVIVIPGFFGYTADGKRLTFSRGGSDITGSIIAAGIKASLYENFTDVDSVYVVNPGIVKNPLTISELSYREMRELSYAGFSVFHDEALIPAFKEKIPVRIKNTNNPKAGGTLIVAEKKPNGNGNCVVGIASDSGFAAIYVSKYLMNRELGFGRKLFQILEDEAVSFEHAPSGIDDMSVIIREDQLSGEKERKIIQRIYSELKADMVTVHRDLAMIMVVGEGMMNTVGVAHQAAAAFAKANINIEMINQGSSEVSMMFGIQARDMEKAIQSLYKTFFT